MVGEAQRVRAPIQRLADMVAALVRPGRHRSSPSITFVVWAVIGPEPRLAHALVNAVAVLIIACPCALGLATPMSIMVGTGRGAEAGVLIRNAEALETLEQVDTLVVDKTGTLTEGKPTLVHRGAAAGFTPRRRSCDWRRVSRRSSEHPLAAAIVRGARERGIAAVDVTRFRVRHRQGRRGIVDGRQVAIGNLQLLADVGIDAALARAAPRRPPHATGRRSMFVAVDGSPAGLLGVADPIKGTTADAIRALHDEGLRVVMLTGDSRTTAEAVARAVGIDQVEAEVLPEAKWQRSSSGCRPRGTWSPWRGTASTTPRRSRRQTWASRWAPAPTSRWRARASRSSRAISAASFARAA